jgi:7-cyano-7-deazaguanine reductase
MKTAYGKQSQNKPCFSTEPELGGQPVDNVDKYASRRFDIGTEDTIDTDVLEAIPFKYPESTGEVIYETSEFTMVCPWTGLPDFARLVIRYTPGHSLVELKSLKYYLTSYRNVGILQEHAVNRILDDLVQLLEPVSMVVEAAFKPRGGLSTRAVAKYDRESNS